MILSLVVVFSSGCGLESPQSPTWSVALQVPLINRSYDIQYIVEQADKDEFRWTADSGAFFRIDRALDTVFVGDHLTVGNLTTSTATEVGAFSLGAGTSTEKELALSDLYPVSGGLIAEFSAAPRLELPAVAEFDSAQVTGGEIRFTVVNNLGIDLDSVTITLFNKGESTPITSAHFPGPILTGDSVSATEPMAAGTLRSQWDTELAFHTPGGTVLTAQDKNVVVRAELPAGIQVTGGTGVIAPIVWQQDDSIRVSEDNTIYDAVLDNGSLTLHWVNNTPVPVTIDWTTDDFTLNGVPLSGNATIAPADSTTSARNLAGYRYETGGTPSVARFHASLSSPGSGSQSVTLNATDGVQLLAGFEGIVLKSATASLAPRTIEIDSLSTVIEWTNGLGNLGLADGSMTLSVTSSIPWESQLEGTVTSGNGQSVAFAGSLQPGAANAPVTSTITVPSIASLLQPLPDLLTVTARVSYGDGSTVGHISASDFIVPRVIVSAPVELYVDSVTLTGDPHGIALQTDDGPDPDGHLIGGTINVSVNNRLPFGAILTLRAAADSIGLTTTPDLLFGPSSVPPATTDGSGHAVEPTLTELHFTVDQTQIHLFEGDSVWVSEDVTLLGPGNGLPARVGALDGIDLQASVRLDVQVGTKSTTGGSQ